MRLCEKCGLVHKPQSCPADFQERAEKAEARSAELKAENVRLQDAADGMTDNAVDNGRRYHAERRRAEKAEALADDLENQIAELCMGLDDAQGRVSELEAAVEKLADDIGEAAGDSYVSQDYEYTDYFGRFEATARQILTGDGSRIMDVRRNLEAIQIRCREGDPKSDWLPIIDRLATEALNRLDGAEGG